MAPTEESAKVKVMNKHIKEEVKRQKESKQDAKVQKYVDKV